MGVGIYAGGQGAARTPLFNPAERAASDETWNGEGAFASEGTTNYASAPAGKDDFVNWSTSPTVMSQAMLGEFVKIAGLRYENREWSWSPDNVARYFSEEPVWATIDAVTLGAPMAKWGKAAYLVGREGSAAGRAYKAGRLGFREAVGIQKQNLAPTTAFGRYITNPVARERFTPEYSNLMKEYGASNWERQAGLDVMRREYQASVIAENNRALNLLDKVGRANLTADQNKAFVRLMEHGYNTEHSAETAAGVSRLLGEQGKVAFESTWQYRSKLGADAIDLDMLGPDAALRQQTYWPQMQKKQYEEALRTQGYRFGQADVLGEASWDNFKWRKYATEEFETNYVRDFDVATGIKRMSMAAQAVNREKFARAMMDTGLVQSADELVDALPGILGNANARRLWGITDESASRIFAAASSVGRHSDGAPISESLAQTIRHELGWQRLQDVAPGLHLPKGYADKFVDPAVVGDLQAAFKLLQGPDGLLGSVYKQSVSMFRVGKTAYNPATHFRNLFGAQVFHTLATGLTSMADGKFWMRGWRAYKGGMEHAGFRRAAEAGVVNATIDRERLQALTSMGDDFFSQQGKTALDWMGDSRMAKAAQAVGGFAERFYRGIDEVSRLDAFERNYELFVKANKHRVLDSKTVKATAVREGSQSARAADAATPIGPGRQGGTELPSRGESRTLDDLAAEGGPITPGSEVGPHTGQRIFAHKPPKPPGQGQIPARAASRGQTLDEAAAANAQRPVPPGSQVGPAAPREVVGPVRGPNGSSHYPLARQGDISPATRYKGGPVGPAKNLTRLNLGEEGGQWTAEELERRASEYAALQVAKYIPSFGMSSRLSQRTRQHIPFSSFSHEAVRVWKNTMTEKPHLAYFWSHFTDFTGEFFGAAAGFSPEEIASAKQGLPYYQDGKKMMMWPMAVDGKPVFVDMSYLIPLANIVEVEREEQTFFGKAASLAGVNPTANPLASLIFAASTGQDVFRGQPIEPRMTERQFNTPIEDYHTRKTVGLAEHIAATFLPPIIPPGYVGLNIAEYARGQAHPQTGADLEDGLWRTLATNLLGVRLHEADANASMLNVGHEEKRTNQLVSDWWERWQWSVANGKDDHAKRAEENIFELQLQRGKSSQEAMEYLRDGVKSREPGAFRNFPKRQLQEALKRLKTVGVGDSAQDAAQMSAMAAAARNERR